MKWPTVGAVLVVFSGVLTSCATLPPYPPVVHDDPLRGGEGGGGKIRLSGLGLIETGRIQPPYYGLYSYVLFPARPADPVALERQRAVIQACFGKIEEVNKIRHLAEDPSQLNIVYIPVTAIPAKSKGLSGYEFTKVRAEAVLAAYDFATAKVMISRLPVEVQDGPVIVAVRRALEQDLAAGEEFLVLDLSDVAPGDAHLWVAHFVKTVVRERHLEDTSLERFGLRLRVILDRLGSAMPPVINAINILKVP